MATSRREVESSAVIRHPRENGKVLVVGGALPHFETEQNNYKGQGVAEALGNLLNLRLNVLRRLTIERLPSDEDVRRWRTTFELEVLGGDVDGQVWMDARELDLQGFERAALDLALTPPSPLRADWQRPGWFARTLDWLDGELASRGRTRRGDPALVHNWQISALWRVETADGPLFLKAVPPFFEREAALTAWLGERFPGEVPPVLAADPARRVWLMEEAGTSLDPLPPETAEAAFRQLARIQRETSAHSGELAELGCLDRGLPVLREQARDLLADDAALGLGREGGLTPGEARTLRDGWPQIEEAFAALEVLNLPPALVHGDFHGGNVLKAAQGAVLLDWSDGALGHPFIDARPHTFYFDENLPPEVSGPLRDAYLQPWADVAPLPALRAAFDAAGLVGELHSAVSYWHYILPHVEDRAEWEDGHLWHLRAALRFLSPAEV